MINHDLARHVPGDRLHIPYEIRDRLVALLDEARRAGELPALAKWGAESTLLVTALARSLEGAKARIEGFERACPVLEKAAHADAVARVQLDGARREHFMGSTDRATALHLRNDLEACESACRVTSRELQAATDLVRGYLPNGAGVPEGPGREIVSEIRNVVIGAKYEPEYWSPTVSEDTWRNWCSMSDADFCWLPLHAARVLASKELYQVGPNHVRLPEADFLERLNALRSDRDAHLRGKLAEARRTLETATKAAAALEGAA